MKKHTPTLEEARRKITGFQKGLLEEIWQHFQKRKKWPTLRSLYSSHGKKRVIDALGILKGQVGQTESGSGRWKEYKLSLLAVLLTNAGPGFQKLMNQFFEYQRELFQTDPDRSDLKSAEISKALKLNAEDTALLGQLLSIGGYGGSSSPDSAEWGTGVWEDTEDFPQTGDLTKQLENRLFRYYHTTNSQSSKRTSLSGYGTPFLSSQFNDPFGAEQHPDEISVSLRKLREKYPEQNKLGFLIMRFTAADPFMQISKVVKATAKKHGLIVVRADEHQYHDELWGNIRTLLHGCSFGIAIYERIDQNQPNANVGLEVGYLMAMNKPVLLLKDQTVEALHSDLAGRLYKNFDTWNPKATIPGQLTSWLKQNGIVVSGQT